MLRTTLRLICMIGFLLGCLQTTPGHSSQTVAKPGPVTSERIESALTDSDVAAIATISRVFQQYQPLASTSTLNDVVTYLVFTDLTWIKGRLPGDSLVVRLPITIRNLPEVDIRSADTPDLDRVLVYVRMYRDDPGFPDGIPSLRAETTIPGRGVMKLRGETGPRSMSEILRIARLAEPVDATRESDLVVIAAPADSIISWCTNGDPTLVCRTMHVERVLKGVGVPERLKVAASFAIRLPMGRSVVFLKRLPDPHDYVRLTTMYGGVRPISNGIVDNGETLVDFVEHVMHAEAPPTE